MVQLTLDAEQNKGTRDLQAHTLFSNQTVHLAFGANTFSHHRILR